VDPWRRGYWLPDDDEDEESGIWIGNDGVGLERDALADCGALLAGARLLGIGTWAFDGGATPLRQELAHVLIFELQVCMHVIQPCVWFVALYCREQVI
jgi:hypothetical protein